MFVHLAGLLEMAGSPPVLLSGLGGAAGLLGGSFALGMRHGIDWDHIAAITDITSAAESQSGREIEIEAPLVPLLGLAPAMAGVGMATGSFGSAPPSHTHAHSALARLTHNHRQPFLLGSLYAVGHAGIVTILGLTAILASQFLPPGVDAFMERVVGTTLILLAAYLFYSLYRYFRGGEFRLRSRWMLVFGVIRNLSRRTRAGLRGDGQVSPAEPPQYGPATSLGIGVIHGIGAETGTQALVIATAVGAGSKGAGVAALLMFVVGLLISNSIITVMSTAGFMTAGRRQAVYVGAGVVAAVFSLVLGLLFLFGSGALLPALDPYVRWLGGPD